MPKFYTLISLLMLSLRLYAAGDTALLRHFTIENGLPSNYVYAVTQDRYGDIWFNTDDGVVKYNGYTFKQFTMADGLPSNDAWKLYPDKRGRLWVSTHGNKIGYIKDDKYKEIIVSKTKAIHPSYINSDNNNVYFILGEPGNDKLITVDANDSVHASSLDTGIITVIGYDNTLMSVINDSIITLRKLPIITKDVDSIVTGFSLWDFLYKSCGESHYGGRLINVGPLHSYFMLADSNVKAYQKIYFDNLGGKKDEFIYTVYQDNDSLTVITNKAIYRLSGNVTAYRRISFADFLPKSVQVSYYWIDKYKNEWYSTTNNGVWCRYNLQVFFNTDSTLHSIYNTKNIGALNNGNTYWLDKNNNIIYEIDEAKKLNKIVPPDNGVSIKIDEINNSEFYLYTTEAAYTYNLKSRKFKNLVNYFLLDTLKRENFPSDVAPLTTDSTGIKLSFQAVWGLTKVNRNRWLFYDSRPAVCTFEIKNHTGIITGLDIARMTAMCYDSADHIYLLSGLNSLAIYTPATNTYLPFNLQALNNFGISSILGLTCDKFSNIYLLDNNKIIVYNFRSHGLMFIKNKFNFSNTFISIYKNNFFVAGKFGIAYAKILGPLHLGEFHAAVNMNNYNRVYDFVINKLGIIYLSTDKGVIDINADEIVNGKLADPGSFFMLNINTPIHRRIISNDTVNLSQDIDKITLNIVNLVGKGNIEYKYVIEGYGVWQKTATGEIVTGTLKAGHYYKVRCSIRDDAWVSKEFVFYIYRVPYWWQRMNWVIVFWISGILAFGAVIFIVMLLTRQVAAKANEKKRALTELELKAIYAQINPHFIFNTLSATLYFINKRKFDEAYLHINKFSRLIRGYLKSSQERYITLADEIEMLKNYIELQKTRFEDKLEYRIEIDNKVPINNIQIPSLLLQPLVENAINHGLFHRKEGGVLLLQFLQGGSSEELICIIDDNGVGRNRAKEIKESSTVQHDSYGTKLTKQLIDVFKEFEKMGIVLEYIDKQLPETGTIVKLTIKNIKYVA